MKRISKKFNWILVFSICFSVLFSSILSTILLLYRTQKEIRERNQIQMESLSDNLESFLANAFSLNYQLSINPRIVESILTAEADWDRRSDLYRQEYRLDSGEIKGSEFLENLAEDYSWVELFFVQDDRGFQTERSSGMIGKRDDRWWYREFMNRRNRVPFVSRSYFSMTGNKPVASVFHPVYSGSRFIGIMGTDINFHYLQEMVSGYLYSDNLYAVVIDSTGTVIAHPHQDYVSEMYNLTARTRQTVRQSDDGTPLLDAEGFHLTEVVPAEIDEDLITAAREVLSGKSGSIENTKIENQLCSLYYKPACYPDAPPEDGYGILLVYNKNSLIVFTRLLIGGITLFIAVCTYLLYLLFHMVFQRKILDPLGILIEGMKDRDITGFREIRVQTGDELELLADTYNRLRNDLADTHRDLQARMAELAISEEGYREFASIGLAMSGKKDKRTVLEMIIRKGMDFCHAEGGTLYLHDPEKKELTFEIIFNDVLDIRKIRSESSEEVFSSVPLMTDGRPNLANVSSCCALKGEIINIPDVYHAEGFNFEGMKSYDRKTGYHSQSMIVIPMKNLEGELVGVLQLINARTPDGMEIVEFSEHHRNLVTVLASQGAVTLTNIQLQNNLEQFLYSFIRSIATAIDEKSHFTSGHIKRVVSLSTLIAEAVNASTEGDFRDVVFSGEEMEELRISAWMHDVGKISIPEDILDKSTKLMFSRDGMEIIRMKARLISALRQKEFLSERLKQPTETLTVDPDIPDSTADCRDLPELISFIETCNSSGIPLTDQDVLKLEQIAGECAKDECGEICLLSPEELHFLSIRRGTLDEEERKIIESHVAVTRKILEHLPFPQHLSRVSEFATQHHEKLDGSGYDQGIGREGLSIQSRIIAISDIFEALTADDRPYRKPLSMETALNIIENMCDHNHIDKQLFRLMTGTDVISAYLNANAGPD